MTDTPAPAGAGTHSVFFREIEARIAHLLMSVCRSGVVPIRFLGEAVSIATFADNTLASELARREAAELERDGAKVEVRRLSAANIVLRHKLGYDDD